MRAARIEPPIPASENQQVADPKDDGRSQQRSRSVSVSREPRDEEGEGDAGRWMEGNDGLVDTVTKKVMAVLGLGEER